MGNSEILNEPESCSSRNHHLRQDVNPALFLSFTGHSIEFFLDLKEFDEKAALAELVIDYGGTYIDNEDSITDWTAIMVDNVVRFDCVRPMFRKDYIKDCVEQNTLLDITNYTDLDGPNSSTSLMDIIFWRKRSFEALNSSFVPRKFSLTSTVSKLETIASPITTGSMVPATKFIEPLPIKRNRRLNSQTWIVSKSTREPYSKKEKEDILKFLIAKERFSGLKGSNIWRNMEVRGVCPKRTYQSLKEHFSKVIMYQLDDFDFLTQEHKDKFRKGFFL